MSAVAPGPFRHLPLMAHARVWLLSFACVVLGLAPDTPLAQSSAVVSGTVRDETGGVLPGVSVELRKAAGVPALTVTGPQGEYRFDGVAPGQYQISFTLVNFATLTRRAVAVAAEPVRLDAVLRLALGADVTVTGKRTFTNLADADDPAQNLVGIAQSASQGAITARQLETRPVMRTGEVLETVPGVIISQHSGEAKANQYYLRGFNLDHGTDFATTVTGIPVNLPTHAHGHGYSDLNFLIPELVSGVQFSKGPYFADQGDFATAGSANITYASVLDRAIVRAGGGGDGFGRVLVAASPRVGAGHLLTALEIGHDDGPWQRPDDYRRVNGVVRYSAGDAVNGASITAMAYRAAWNSTDQIPQRAVTEGLIGRFGAVDPTDGGDTYRYSGALEWQRTRGNGVTKVAAYGLAYDLSLLSNFTYFLDDPVHGDQFEQADHRFVTGARISHRRLSRWQERSVQNTFGVQLRNDDISTVALYRTEARRRLGTIRQDAVVQTSGAVYAQNEVEWTPWVRTLAGVRADGYRFRVDSIDTANSGSATAGLVSPKAGVVLGPWEGTELYANAGEGFHSNDARGATITRDPTTGRPAGRVTPLVRARGLEVGVRTVALPHLQSSLALWNLALASELVFAGDAGTTEAGRPSRRYGVEWANYYSPTPWLIVDADLSVSRGRFTNVDPAGDMIPGAVETVFSAGTTIDEFHKWLGSVRMRYFGPRPLVEDNSVRSKPTNLTYLQAGYALTERLRIAVDVFNVFDAKDSDIDYYYTSRLTGEPAGGTGDVHFHPTLPRTARINVIVGF